jgi:hypothetical protein
MNNYFNKCTERAIRALKGGVFPIVTIGTWFSYFAQTYFKAVGSTEYMLEKATDLMPSASNSTIGNSTQSTSFNPNDTDPTIFAPSLLFATGTLLIVMLGRTPDLYELFYGAEKKPHENKTPLLQDERLHDAIEEKEEKTIAVIEQAKNPQCGAKLSPLLIKSIGIVNLIPSAVFTYLSLTTTFEKIGSLTGFMDDDPQTNQIASLCFTATFMVQVVAFGRKRAFENAKELGALLEKHEFRLDCRRAFKTLCLATPNVIATIIFNYFGAKSALPKFPNWLKALFPTETTQTAFIIFSTVMGLLNPLVTFVPAIYKHKSSTIQIKDYESRTLSKLTCGLTNNPYVVLRNMGYMAGLLDAIGSGFLGNVKSLAYTWYNASNKNVDPYAIHIRILSYILGASGFWTTWSYAVLPGLRKLINRMGGIEEENQIADLNAGYVALPDDPLRIYHDLRVDTNTDDEDVSEPIGILSDAQADVDMTVGSESPSSSIYARGITLFSSASAQRTPKDSVLIDVIAAPTEHTPAPFGISRQARRFTFS